MYIVISDTYKNVIRKKSKINILEIQNNQKIHIIFASLCCCVSHFFYFLDLGLSWSIEAHIMVQHLHGFSLLGS